MTMSGFSRRAALGSAGILAALGLGSRLGRAAAQDVTTAMANHPIVGTWLTGRAPNGLGVVHWGSDGNMSLNGAIISTGPDGAVAYSDVPMGTWEPQGQRGIHFTFTFATYDATGAVTGYVTVEGHPIVANDGQSFWDDAAQATVTLRDASGAVTEVIGEGAVPPIGGVRMAPGRPGYDQMLALLADQQAAGQEPGTPAP